MYEQHHREQLDMELEYLEIKLTDYFQYRDEPLLSERDKKVLFKHSLEDMKQQPKSTIRTWVQNFETLVQRIAANLEGNDSRRMTRRAMTFLNRFHHPPETEQNDNEAEEDASNHSDDQIKNLDDMEATQSSDRAEDDTGATSADGTVDGDVLERTEPALRAGSALSQNDENQNQQP